MKVRIASGIIAIAIVILVMSLSREAFHIVCVILSFIALNELFGAFENKGYKPLRISGYLACVCLLLGSIATWNRNIYRWLINIINFIDVWSIMYIALMLLFTILVLSRGKVSVTDLSVTMLSTFYVCFLFWRLVMLRNLPSGMFLVWFVIIGAVATDTGAYFVGTVFGKHKLLPDISPKKTVEGAVGGVLACVAAFFIYGYFYRVYVGSISVLKLVSMALTCGVISQLGDFAASAIKRFCGIKDFGRIIPGHGGILDRLDSVLLTAPLIYMFMA